MNWNGSVSSDWSNAANWTLVQGTYSGAPTITDIAQIGVAGFTNQPVITTAAVAKTIKLGSTQAVTITLNTGGSLVVDGTINGTWSTNATHNIIANAQNVTINGDLVLSDNTAGHAINLSVGTGTSTINGGIVQSGGANIVFTGAGTLNIGKDFLYTSGTFTPSTGLVKYTGSISQVVAAVPYNNLTIIKTGGSVAALGNTANLAGNLVITSGELDINSTLNINGSVTITGILDGGAATINLAGSWTKTGTFNTASSTINMTGTAIQNVSAGIFNIFTVNKTGGSVVLTGNNTLNGNLNLLSGTLNLSTFTFNQASTGDVFTMANNTTLLVSGAANFPANFVSYNLATNSLVHYNGTIAQAVADVPYGNITFSNGGSLEKTFSGSSTINGNLIINSGASLNGATYTITLNGNWTNNSGTFTPATSNILFNGSNKTITGNTVFNDATINGIYVVSTSDLTYNGHFQVTPGGSYMAGSGVATVNGDFTNAGSVTSSGTTTFSGTVLQNIRLVNALISTSTGIVNFNGSVSPIFNSTSTPTFATLNINNTAGINPSVNWVVLGSFTVSSGATFNGGISTHTFSRNFTNNGTVTSTGNLSFIPTTSVSVQLAGTSFASTGTVMFGGSGAIAITGTPTALQDVVIANTNAAGITATSAWNMSGNFSVNSDAIFNAASYGHVVGGNIESDGILNGNTSTFTMTSPAGQISGSPGTLFNHFTITGSITSESDFNVAGDFTNNGTYDGSIGALIMTGSAAANISGTTTPSAIELLTISKTAAVVTCNVNISSLSALLINSGTLFTSTYSLTQNAAGGVIIIANGATLKLGGTNTIPAFSGYGLDTASTVDYAGTTQAISNGPVYGNLTISTAGNKSILSGLPLTIAGNLTITAGNFVANNNIHKLAGNWIMTGGTFTNTNSTIRFNGNYDQDIQTIAPFNSINISKTNGVVTTSTDITVNAVLSFTTGKIRTGTRTVIIPASGAVTGASQSTGWVRGFLQKNVATGTSISRTYEIGGNTNYTPATVTFASVGTAGNLTATVTGTDQPQVDYSGLDSTKSVNRYWALTNSGIVFTSATTNFNWVATDVDAIANTSNFKVGILSGGSWTLPTVSAPTATSINATVTSFGEFAIGERIGLYKWTGQAFTSDWNTAANWSGGIPNATLNTLIPTGITGGRVYPILTTGTGTISNITIQPSATLTISGGTLQIAGTISNTGTFTATNGSIEMNGSLAQTIPANTFQTNTIKDLIINNNVTLGGTTAITGVLSFASAAKTLTTGGFLTLKSTSAGTARIAALPVDASGNATSFISGTVSVERYIPMRRAWRLLTAPLSNTGSIFNSWQNAGAYTLGSGTFITGVSPSSSNGLDSSIQNSVSMKTYSTSSQAFINIANTKTFNLSNNTGAADNTAFFMFIRGDRNTFNLNPSYSNNTTLKSTGTIQTGKQVFPASGVYNKYTIMGNPYASPVDFNNVQRTRIMKRFYAWDPHLNKVGGYVVLDDLDGDGIFSKSVPSSTQDKFIQSGQAFFVITDTAGSARLTYYESSKGTSVSNSVFRPVGKTSSFDATLNLVETDGSTVLADAAIAEFNDDYTENVDLQDAIKFGNINETFSLSRNGTSLSIERRPMIKNGDTLFFKLTKATARDYQFVIGMNDIDPSVIAWMEDKFTGSSTPVNTSGTTTINFSINNDTASAVADRFRIVFRQEQVLPVSFTGITAKQQSGDIKVNWTVAQQVNVKHYEVEKSTDGRNFTSVNIEAANRNTNHSWTDVNAIAGDNFYRIRSVLTDGAFTLSKVVKVTIEQVRSGMLVFPNPVTDGVIKLQLNSLPAGNYSASVVNASGQVLLKKDIQHLGGSSAQKIMLPKYSAKGMYRLEVVQPANKGTTIINVMNQ